MLEVRVLSFTPTVVNCLEKALREYSEDEVRELKKEIAAALRSSALYAFEQYEEMDTREVMGNLLSYINNPPENAYIAYSECQPYWFGITAAITVHYEDKDVCFFHDIAKYLSNRAVSSIYLHELVHLSGVHSELEAFTVQEYTARRNPELLASQREIEKEMKEVSRKHLEYPEVYRLKYILIYDFTKKVKTKRYLNKVMRHAKKLAEWRKTAEWKKAWPF